MVNEYGVVCRPTGLENLKRCGINTLSWRVAVDLLFRGFVDTESLVNADNVPVLQSRLQMAAKNMPKLVSIVHIENDVVTVSYTHLTLPTILLV